MPTPDCDCPICVLYYADLQICDLRVILTKRGGNKLNFTMRHDALSTFAPNRRAIENSIMALIYKADTTPLKVKYFCEVDKPEYSLKIERLSKNEYKFCFHSNLKPVPDDEEADPLPMD